MICPAGRGRDLSETILFHSRMIRPVVGGGGPTCLKQQKKRVIHEGTRRKTVREPEPVPAPETPSMSPVSPSNDPPRLGGRGRPLPETKPVSLSNDPPRVGAGPRPIGYSSFRTLRTSQPLALSGQFNPTSTSHRPTGRFPSGQSRFEVDVFPFCRSWRCRREPEE